MPDLYDLQDKILDRLSSPQVYFPQDSLIQKSAFASYVSELEDKLILVPTTYVFSNSSFFAGLTESQLVFLAKNAPQNYRQEILNSIDNVYRVREMLEIAAAMDDDISHDYTKNQERVKNVIQYINDNRIAFEL